MAEDLLAILQARGLQTTEETGWRDRGGRRFEPVGVIIHHTAGTGIKTILSGRMLENGKFLPPPLANLYIAKSGQVHLVAAGRANHAGPGVARVLDEVRRNTAPVGSIQERGLKDDKPQFVGNPFFYGIEAENRGTGKDPWPEIQLEAIRRTSAALCDHHGWPAARVIAHKEWTQRKIDPKGFEMADLRDAVAKLLVNPITIEEATVAFDLAGTIPVPGGQPDALGRFPFWGWRRDGSVFAFNGAPGPVPSESDKKTITADGPVVAMHPRTDGVPGYYLIAGQPDDAGGFPTFAFPKPGRRGRSRRGPA